jgi:hypothetical protein
MHLHDEFLNPFERQKNATGARKTSVAVQGLFRPDSKSSRLEFSPVRSIKGK